MILRRSFLMKGFRLIWIVTVVMLVLAACGDDKSTNTEEKSTIKVGTSPGPYSELFLDAIKPILEEDGFEVETIDFTQLLQADIALDEGSVDLNVDQHTAYYSNFNEEKGTNVTKITPIPTIPACIFPSRKRNVQHVERGDTIGIPKARSNDARAYASLEKADLSEPDDDVQLVKMTKKDIKTNKENVD